MPFNENLWGVLFNLEYTNPFFVSSTMLLNPLKTCPSTEARRIKIAKPYFSDYFCFIAAINNGSIVFSQFLKSAFSSKVSSTPKKLMLWVDQPWYDGARFVSSDGAVNLLALHGAPVSGSRLCQHHPALVKLAAFLGQVFLLEKQKVKLVTSNKGCPGLKASKKSGSEGRGFESRNWQEFFSPK